MNQGHWRSQWEEVADTKSHPCCRTYFSVQAAEAKGHPTTSGDCLQKALASTDGLRLGLNKDRDKRRTCPQVLGLQRTRLAAPDQPAGSSSPAASLEILFSNPRAVPSLPRGAKQQGAADRPCSTPLQLSGGQGIMQGQGQRACWHRAALPTREHCAETASDAGREPAGRARGLRWAAGPREQLTCLLPRSWLRVQPPIPASPAGRRREGCLYTTSVEENRKQRVKGRRYEPLSQKHHEPKSKALTISHRRFSRQNKRAAGGCPICPGQARGGLKDGPAPCPHLVRAPTPPPARGDSSEVDGHGGTPQTA